MVVTMISTMSPNLSVPPSLSSLLTALMVILYLVKTALVEREGREGAYVTKQRQNHSRRFLALLEEPISISG